jgi:hypothetical protein
MEACRTKYSEKAHFGDLFAIFDFFELLTKPAQMKSDRVTQKLLIFRLAEQQIQNQRFISRNPYCTCSG